MITYIARRLGTGLLVVMLCQPLVACVVASPALPAAQGVVNTTAPPAQATAEVVQLQPATPLPTTPAPAAVTQPAATEPPAEPALEPTVTSPPIPIQAPTATPVPPTAVPKAPDQKGTGRGGPETPAAQATPTTPPTTVPATLPPTAAAAPTTPPTREPTIRNLYSVYLVRHGSPVPGVLGNKGDDYIYTGEQLPAGCEIVDVFGIDYNMIKNQPSRAPAPSVSDALHGWDVTRQATGPRDIGVRVHWFFNAGGNVQMRIYYVVRQPHGIDCALKGKTQDEP